MSVGWSQIGDEAAFRLAEMPTLESLSIGMTYWISESTNVTEEGLKVLCRKLQLRELNISKPRYDTDGNTYADSVAVAIARNLPGLVVLQANLNNFGSEAMKPISSGLL